MIAINIDVEFLVNENLRLVRFFASRFSQQYPMLEHDEAVGIGNLALLKAAQEWNPLLGPFGSWAARHIRRSLTAWAKRVTKMRTVHLDAASVVSHSTEPGEQIERQELSQRLSVALGRLNKLDRSLIMLRFGFRPSGHGGYQAFEPFSFTRIGEMLGLSRQSAERKYGRALIRIRKVLDKMRAGG